MHSHEKCLNLQIFDLQKHFDLLLPETFYLELHFAYSFSGKIVHHKKINK